MSFIEKRKYERRPFVKPIIYFVKVSKRGEVEKIHNDAVSINISAGGLGMITGYPLKGGDILYFEPVIKVNDFTAKSAIVKCVLEIENHRYLVGLEFVK